MPAAAAVAAAAAVVLVVRLAADRGGDASLARETLALLAAPAGARGPGDPVSAAAGEVAERWRAGHLRLRASRVHCPQGERWVMGLVDARGDPALLAVRESGRTDVHLYAPDGSEAGAARIARGARADYLLPPLARSEARALLEASSCAEPPR